MLIVSGGQLLALGLLAEMQVRYHYEDRSRRLVSDATIIHGTAKRARRLRAIRKNMA